MYLVVHDDVSTWHKRNNTECSREYPRRKLQLSDIVLNLAVQVEGEYHYHGRCRVGPTNMHVRWTDTRVQVAARRSSANRNRGKAKLEKSESVTAARSDLCSAIFPVYYLGKLCGLIPVKFISHTAGRYQACLNIVDLLYR